MKQYEFISHFLFGMGGTVVAIHLFFGGEGRGR